MRTDYKLLEWNLKEATVPLSKKGKKIKKSMTKQYGKKKGEKIFYASANKGTITNIDKKRST